MGWWIINAQWVKTLSWWHGEGSQYSSLLVSHLHRGLDNAHYCLIFWIMHISFDYLLFYFCSSALAIHYSFSLRVYNVILINIYHKRIPFHSTLWNCVMIRTHCEASCCHCETHVTSCSESLKVTLSFKIPSACTFLTSSWSGNLFSQHLFDVCLLSSSACMLLWPWPKQWVFLQPICHLAASQSLAQRAY